MNKFIYKSALITLGMIWVILFSQAIFAQNRTQVWIVADSKTECPGAATMKCLQMRKPQDEQWSVLTQNIERFKYEDGYTYVVRLKVDTIKNPPADGSAFKYTLKKVVNRKKTGGTIPAENKVGTLPKQNNSGLTGKAWQLTAIDGNAISTDKATLNFDFDKNSVGGNGGCNVFGGTLSGNGDMIKISQIISTKMFCENGSEVENKYLPKLEQVNKYKIAGGKLRLFRGNKIVLEFTAKS